jgi:DNA-binding CsgD family transcriptional regulator
VIPFDNGGWWTADSDTLLPTEMWKFDYAMVENEIVDDDFIRLADLDAQGRVSASLSLTTDGDKARSTRYLTRHVPAGVGDEMRVLARSGDKTWGAACITRGDDMPDFTAEEVRYIGSIARDVGAALRSALLHTATTRLSGPETRAGTLIVGSDDTIEGFTPEAAHWLERLGIVDHTAQLPTAMRWVALQARARELSLVRRGQLHAARSRMPLPDGDFVVVKAEPLHGSAESKIVITFEPADHATLLPLLMALYGLSPQERVIADRLVEGWSLADIAASMHLSLHTVRDHVKSMYAKVDVRTRPELTARLSGAAK